MKRQRSRNRGGGGSGGGGGGGKPSHNVNRAFESNGPEGMKVRGNAQHVFEKYQQLARDAASAGDRILAENHLQHAEHYFRVLRAVQPNRPVTEIMGRDAFTSGIDIDFEDENGGDPYTDAGAEGEAQAQGQPQQPSQPQNQGEPRQEQGRYENRDQRSDYRQDRRPDYRNDGNRSEGARQDNNTRQDGGRNEGRQDRYEGRSNDRGNYARDDRPRDDRPRDDRSQQTRDDRPQQSRDDRPQQNREGQRSYRDDRRDRYEGRGDRNERGDQPRGGDPLPVVEPQATPLTQEARADEGSPMLRSQDGGVSHAPAFLQQRTESSDEGSAERRAPAKRTRPRAPKAAAETTEEA